MQAAVQQLLSTHGFYSPIELLLATNRLGYDDYQGWRRGEHRNLDPCLPDGVTEARTLLEQAATWARALHLDPEAVSFFGTDTHSGIELKASADPPLDDLLHVEYRRDVDRAQPDLFLDGAQAQIQNELVDAIAARNTKVCDGVLRRLAALDDQHWAISHAVVLIDALRAATPNQAEGTRRRLEVMETVWLPAASALLGAAARDFLSPLWRDLGEALEGLPYDTINPKVHASWAYLNGLDWANVKRTVLDVPTWESEPALQIRIALARWRLAEYVEAIRAWFLLCWRFPGHFAECVESPAFPNSSLQRAWMAAQDHDIEPPITPPWFPAWMLIEQPGMAKSIGRCGGNTAPERAFDHLVALHGGHSDREDLELRRSLKNLHPDLLAHYLASKGE